MPVWSRVPAWAPAALLGLNVVLCLPTAFAPGTTLAGATYLTGFALVVGVLWAAALRRDVDARSWAFVAAAATCWIVGDVVARVAPGIEEVLGGVGAVDVLWLAGYPLIGMGVLTRIRRRGLSVGTRRVLVLDSVALGVAALAVAWQLLVLPSADPSQGVLAVAVDVSYPLGDVLLLSMACVLALAPGRRPGDVPLALCLAVTFGLDALYTIVPAVAPDVDTVAVDAALLVANTLLGVAALRPVPPPATERPEASAMPVSRVVVLGAALVAAPAFACLWPQPHLSTRLLLLGASTTVGLIVVARLWMMVQALEASERSANHEATHDHLTGLANRSLLIERAAHLLDDPERARRTAMLFVDVDHFKQLNDALGHGVGDLALQAIAAQIVGAVRGGDLVARIGGDEFAVLCPDVDVEDARRVAARLVDPPGGALVVGGRPEPVRLSVGLTHGSLLRRADGPLDDVATWLRAADASMYLSKHRRR